MDLNSDEYTGLSKQRREWYQSIRLSDFSYKDYSRTQGSGFMQIELLPGQQADHR